IASETNPKPLLPRRTNCDLFDPSGCSAGHVFPAYRHCFPPRRPSHPTTSTTMRAHPDRGLHDPASEHDSCGFGLIARIEGDAERRIVDIALEALSRMAHRGGVNADGLTGDGCGVLIHGADRFVRTIAAESRIALHAGPVAAGLVFLPRGAAGASARGRWPGWTRWWRVGAWCRWTWTPAARWPARPRRASSRCSSKATRPTSTHSNAPCSSPAGAPRKRWRRSRTSTW